MMRARNLFRKRFGPTRDDEPSVHKLCVPAAEDIAARRRHRANPQRLTVEQPRVIDLPTVVLALVVLVSTEVEDLAVVQQRGVNRKHLGILGQDKPAHDTPVIVSVPG